MAAPAYAFIATFALLKVIGALMPLRVTEREEATGLDLVSHGEEAYPTGEGAILVEPEEGETVRRRSPRLRHQSGALAIAPHQSRLKQPL